MFNKNTIATLWVALLLANTVQAQSGYAGGGFAFLNYSEPGVEDASLTSIYGRLGTFFNENFSGEIRAGFGVGDDTVSVPTGLGVVSADIELDNFFGVYVRGGMQAAENFYPYAILGYTRGELTASIPGFVSISESESDVSFGLGADVKIGESATINAEYMNYLDKDDAEVDGFSIGIAFSF